MRDTAGGHRQTDWTIGQKIGWPHEPPMGTHLRGEDVHGPFEVVRTPQGWRFVDEKHASIAPVNWRTALTVWGPADGSPFVVVNLT